MLPSKNNIFLYIDEAVNTDLAAWKKNVDKYGDVVVGSTEDYLNGSNCRSEECNLGNLITDSMVYAVSYSFK